jgi:hypothetical protein
MFREGEEDARVGAPDLIDRIAIEITPVQGRDRGLIGGMQAAVAIGLYIGGDGPHG